MRQMTGLYQCSAVAFLLLCCAPRWVGAEPVTQREFQAALQRLPDLARGRELFPTCAACHGVDGAGAADGSVPAIAGQYYPVILKQLVDFRDDRRWNLRMEEVLRQRHLVGLADFADIAGYVSRLRPHASHDVGDGSALRAGTDAYFRVCVSCHGALGQGSGAHLIPRLGGQHYTYLVREIVLAGDRRRPNMAEVHGQTVRKLSLDEINGMADYLSRLDPAAERR